MMRLMCILSIYFYNVSNTSGVSTPISSKIKFSKTGTSSITILSHSNNLFLI